MMKIATTHPSNELFNGRQRDFLDAMMRLYKAQFDFEEQLTSKFASADDPPQALKLDEEMKQSFVKYRAEADKAVAIYQKQFEVFKVKVLDDLRAAELPDIAEAFERDDYSSLAI